jgi:uncharacterized protein with HEPN domain
MKRDELYLRHVLEAVERISEYISVGYDEFMSQAHWQDAVIRQLEIIGEATKRISGDLRSLHPDVPWRRISGLRDVLIHNYMRVDLQAVWEVTQRDIPELERSIRTILESLGNDG